jgi:hypothetical protein
MDNIALVSGPVTVHSWGTIVHDHPTFATSTFGAKDPTLYPVGFRCTSQHPSLSVDGNAPSALLSVERPEEGGAALFKVEMPQLADSPVFTGSTPTEALNAFYDSLPAPPKKRPMAGSVWGFSEPAIRAGIAQLPGAAEVVQALKSKTEAKRTTAAVSRLSASLKKGKSTGSAADAAASADGSTAPVASVDDENLVVSLITSAAAKTPKPKAKRAKAAGAGESTGDDTPAAKAKAKATPAGDKASVGKKTAAPGAPKAPTAATTAAAAAAAHSKKDECSDCHLSLTLPFCAVTGQPHVKPTPAPRTQRQPKLNELKVASGSSEVIGVEAAAAGATEASETATKKKRARPAAAVAAPKATPVTEVDADAAADDVDDDDVPIAFAVSKGVVAAAADAAAAAPPKKRGPRSEKAKAAAEAKAQQPTLDSVLVPTTAEAAQEKLVATLQAQAPPKKPPRKAVPRPLLDKMSLKTAKEQFDFEDGFKPTSAAVEQLLAPLQASFTKPQRNRYVAFAWEFLGERPKLDLIRRHKQRVQQLVPAGSGAAAETTDEKAAAEQDAPQDAPPQAA